MEQILRFRHNVMDISTISAFENIKGGINRDCKDVYFVRAVGTNGNYIEDIRKMDESLVSQMEGGNGFYKRLSGLPKLFSVDDSEFYAGCYEKWITNGKTALNIKATGKDRLLSNMLGNACLEIEKIYKSENRQLSDSIIKNYMVKILYWFDSVFENMDCKWDERTFIKIVAANVVKKQEYMFFYMLTFMGCDVLLLQNSHDISEDDGKLGLSAKFVLGSFSDVAIPEFDIKNFKLNMGQKANQESAVAQSNSMTNNNKIQVHIPKRERRSRNVSGQQQVQGASQNVCPSKRAEKSFEELAMLASSVVLIAIHDKGGKVIGTGSGIMIGEKGYILTNNHVASGGVYYSVRIEEDDNEYNTDEVIKYNPVLDLAVIRIEKKLNPIKVYCGSEKLVRGQKVVAIGSPLGLFNSVSDGIISGFRKMENVDMIQFTAPISHGSSGGAVLNMQGEVIGISTAGIDSGQNINLAVGYESINRFIKGFI